MKNKKRERKTEREKEREEGGTNKTIMTKS